MYLPNDKPEPDKEDKKKTGITEIIDANPPGTLFGVYANSIPQYFVRLMKRIQGNMSGQLQRVAASRVWHITVFPLSVKFVLTNVDFYNDYNSEIGHYMRVGQPLFEPVYDKIIELEGFEKAQLAKDFGDLKRRNIIGIEMPAGLTLEQQKTTCKYYEAILNETDNQENNDINGLNAIKNVALGLSNSRAVPVQPDRGKMEVFDTRNPVADKVNEKIEDRRKIICESVGMPFEYFYGSRNGDKTDLRRYIRYNRMVKRIQSGIAESIQRLYKAHFENLGETIELANIEVKFYNSINIAELDKLEFVDANVSLLKSFDGFVNDLHNDPTIGEFINPLAKLRYYEKVFKTFEGADGIINIPEESNEKKLEKLEYDMAKLKKSMNEVIINRF
jgi:hypothetical protein